MIENRKSGTAGNWLSKLLSLITAIAVWFTVYTHIDSSRKTDEPPVPGTAEPIPIPDPTPTPILPPKPIIPGN